MGTAHYGLTSFGRLIVVYAWIFYRHLYPFLYTSTTIVLPAFLLHYSRNTADNLRITTNLFRSNVRA